MPISGLRNFIKVTLPPDGASRMFKLKPVYPPASKASKPFLDLNLMGGGAFLGGLSELPFRKLPWGYRTYQWIILGFGKPHRFV